MLFVHVTEDCYKSAEHYGVERKRLDELKKAIEKSQSDEMFEKNARPFLVKQGFAKKAGRLIAHKVFTKVGNESHAVIVFLKMMMYDSDDFAKNINWHSNETFNREFKSLQDIQPDFIHQFVSGRLSKNDEMIIEREKLSSEEVQFLYFPVDASGSDGRKQPMICESDRWQVALKDLDLDQLWPCIRETVECIYVEGPSTDDGRVQYQEVKKIKGYSIAYQWIENALFLANIRGVANGKFDELGVVPSEVATNIELARRYVYREYPQYMLYDVQLWNELEKERYGNLSLSPEEADILHPQPSGTPSFPLFVRGRAGSGKSTVLQYLFAEYFARYAAILYSENGSRNFENAGPAYFACNELLVKKAKEIIGCILRNNPNYSSAPTENVKAIQRALSENGCYGSCFNVYKDFLLSLLPLEIRETRFNDDGYIDYARFEEAWSDKFKGKGEVWKQRCRAEFSWYIIRTFIKGASPNGLLEDSDALRSYLEREGKELEWAVQSEMYKDVYRDVWADWYENLIIHTADDKDVKAWDDQDLVRYVLDQKLFKGPKYLGVFCDEAQDFTSLDLHFILHTTIYPQRIINRYEDLRQLPFAFAGDEFQTLNPSGFSWSQLRTSFVEMLVEGVCPQLNLGRLKVDLDRQMRELENNYRSRFDVVRFGNSVQYYRAQKFDLHDLKPQKEWRDRRGMPVAFYPDNDELFWDNVMLLKGLHILVPCQEKAELEYLDNNPELSKHVERNADGTTTPVVLSAMQAKGLEYPCVVVYGFGEYLYKLSKEIAGAETDGSKRLTMAYFTNKLYVAVTRAQDQLVILDTQKGVECLWENFMDIGVLCEDCEKSTQEVPCSECDRMPDSSVNPSIWKGHIGRLTMGLANYLAGTDIEFDPRKMAEDYLNRAEFEKDPKFMKLAANFFEQCHDDESSKRLAQKCRAMALMYEKSYESAAVQLKAIGDIAGACDCWWLSSNPNRWHRIAELSYQMRQDDYAHKERLLISRACSGDRIDVLRAALDVVITAKEHGGLEDFGTRPWTAALEKAVKLLLASVDYAPAEDSIRLEKLAHLGISLSNATVKKLRFKATVFPESLLYFDEGDLEQSRLMVDEFRKAGPGQWSIWGGAERDGGFDPDRQHALINAFRCVTNNSEDRYEKLACDRAMAILRIRQMRRGTAFNYISDKYVALQRSCGEDFPYRLLAYAAEDCVKRNDEEPDFIKMESRIRDSLRKIKKNNNKLRDGLTKCEFGVALRWIIGDRKESTKDIREDCRAFYEAGRMPHQMFEWDMLLKEVLRDWFFKHSRNTEPQQQSADVTGLNDVTKDAHTQPTEKEKATRGGETANTTAEEVANAEIHLESKAENGVTVKTVAVKEPEQERTTSADAEAEPEELVLQWGAFVAKYYREAKAMDFTVKGRLWTVEDGCVKINRKKHAELCNVDVPIEGTPFVLFCSKEKAVFKDVNAGLNVEILFS